MKKLKPGERIYVDILCINDVYYIVYTETDSWLHMGKRSYIKMFVNNPNSIYAVVWGGELLW